MKSILLFTSIFTFSSISAEDPLGEATDCPRIRRAWHELTQSERDLYINGLMEVRAKSEGDVTIDEFIAIASVHEDEFAPVTHKASNYLYWHGYLTWELENRIRALGGEYSCFGMPYWDFTIEAGREQTPSIFSTGLGGNGDPDNYFTVNEYSWPYTTEQFWVPFNCYAQNDNYPVCSLKRALRDNFNMPTAQEIGQGIMDNPDFTQFAKWYATGYNPVHLFTGVDFLQSPNPVTTSYDPIWYLFHSMVQYHQAIWTDCFDYDLIDPSDLDNHPSAYKPYCVHGECVDPKKYPDEWMGMGLDSVMHFGGKLEDKAWSYVHDNDLTVRKLYHLPRWGIVYDLGKEDGFYQKSGLKDFCAGKLNDRWFITDTDNPYAPNTNELFSASSNNYTPLLTNNTMMICILSLIVFVIFGLYYLAKQDNKGKFIDTRGHYLYGSVGNHL